MNFLYQLKNAEHRKRFCEEGSLKVSENPDYMRFLRAVCLIKDGLVRKGEELLDDLIDQAVHQRLSRSDSLVIYELVAVLWAQREKVTDRLAGPQAAALKTMFDILGGTAVFGVSLAMRQEEEHIAQYEKVNSVDPLQVFIVFRESWWTDGTSRTHELGTRLHTAFAEGGWAPHLVGPTKLDTIAAQVTNQSAILLDVDALGPRACSEFILKLPRDVLTIGYISDYHHLVKSIEHNGLRELIAQLSVVWTASHDASQHATLMDHNNFTDFPIPTGVRRQQLISLREKRESMPWSASFVGSIERTCLPRIVYLIALQGNDHISFDLSSHLADGLTPDQSFAQYLNRLTSTQVNVNFSLRSNGAAIRTGRIMETIGSAGLLVQEYCPLIRRWFSEDKHFIGFTNEIDLRETLDKIVTDPKRYQEIRLAGTNFYEQNYSPIQMTKHLSSFRY